MEDMYVCMSCYFPPPPPPPFSFRGKGFSIAHHDIFLEIICAHRDVLGIFYQLLYLSLQEHIQDFLNCGGGGGGGGGGFIS